jgi:glycosyltransferase involved in cell wall biosynthesis
MTRIKVLQLATAGPLYGAERWILALIANHDPAEVESAIAVIDDLGGEEPPLLAAARAAGITCHRIPCRGRMDPAAIRHLRRLLREGGFDVVHSHGYKADLMTVLAAWRTPVATVATPHGWSEHADWKLKAYEWGDRALFGLFDAVAPLSPDLRDGILRNPLAAKRVHYIGNGLDLTEVDRARAAYNQRPVRGRGLVVGYCGQLIARKDVSTLLKAFARWRNDDAELLIIGEGADRAALENEAKALRIWTQVQFAGYRPDRLEWMARCDLFVLPALREGVPRCLMEAMALRVPVMASDIPGNRDIVIPGRTGSLFAPGDVDALAQLLTQFEAMPAAERDAQVDSAHTLIDEEYSGRKMASSYQALFSQVARRAAAAE